MSPLADAPRAAVYSSCNTWTPIIVAEDPVMSEPRSPSLNSTPAKPTRARKARSVKATREASPVSGQPTTITADDRQAMIATAAYYRAEQRHFVPGSELEDWIAAESEIDSLIVSGGRPA